MSIHLLTLAGVYLFLNFPLSIIMLVRLITDVRSETGFAVQLYLFFLTYSVTLSLCPSLFLLGPTGLSLVDTNPRSPKRPQ